MAKLTLHKTLDKLKMLQQNSLLASQSFLTQHVRALLALIWRFLTPTTQVDTSTARQKPVVSRRLFHERIPRGSWDSHMHVVDPLNYPIAKDALYCPKSYTLDQAISFESSVALDNMVLVQPSIYGNDNTCMLDALRKLGPQRGRAVVGFEPQTIPMEELKGWHELGVRGVRINFSSVGKSMGREDLRSLLHRYAQDCRPLDWVIQLYMPMEMISLLEPIVPELGVRVCIDHMGHPSLDQANSTNINDIRGFQSLLALLKGGKTFVKLSAPYRLSKADDYSDLKPAAQEILKVAGKSNVLFATDFPHTRYEGLDIRPWMDMVLEWCQNDDVLIERLFKGNAEDLWDVQSR